MQPAQLVPCAPTLHVPGEEFRRMLSGVAVTGLDGVALGRNAAAPFELPSPAADRVSIDLVLWLFATAEDVSGDVHIGLHAARHAPPNHIVAHLAAASPTLRDGIEQLDRYQSLLFGAGTIQLRLDRRAPEIVVVPGLRPDASRHLTEYWIASLCGEMVSIAGPAARPRAVRFAHARIGEAAEYARAFGCPVRFGAPTSGVRLWHDALSQPSQCASRHVATVLERVVRTRLAMPDHSPLRDRVAAALRASLAARRPGNRAAVARQFSMSVRTLQRQLAREGATFRQLHDRVRMERTIRMASEGSVTAAMLASAIGFTDSAALCRAFKRWTGVTTREYRSSGRTGRDRQADLPAAPGAIAATGRRGGA